MLAESRKHPRSRQQIHVQLFSVSDSHVSELPTVENISMHGARLATARFWEPGLHVDLKSSTGNLWGRARIVYCQSMSTNTFAVGLNFLTWTLDWEGQTHSFTSSDPKQAVRAWRAGKGEFGGPTAEGVKSPRLCGVSEA